MIELPEALTLAKQLNQTLAGKTVARVLPPTKPHKFCWFTGAPEEYDARLRGRAFLSAEGFGIYVEMTFEGGQRLSLNDGVNVRYLAACADAPKDYQLLIAFSDGAALVFTVAMYGGMYLTNQSPDDPYDLASRNAVSPFSDAFAAYYESVLENSKPTLSLKALLATEQRFAGIGNGVLQDILFAARVHPKRKLSTLTREDRSRLLGSMLSVLGEMTAQGGRDTEKDLYGKQGGYRTKMSKIALASGCPVCGGAIVKETYLGGSVYYCPKCQPL